MDFFFEFVMKEGHIREFHERWKAVLQIWFYCSVWLKYWKVFEGSFETPYVSLYKIWLKIKKNIPLKFNVNGSKNEVQK